jgi:uncharacterized protein (TIGR02594 family)
MTPPLPRWLKTANKLRGVREIPGLNHNPIILEWLSALKAWWHNDETPWCGVFVAYCLKESGLPYPSLYMRAKSWADYGSLLRPDRLSPGAILVFDRKGGGHVGFYIGEDAGFYYVLGGNQSNSVNVMKLGKSRLVASRWPKNEPVLGRPVQMKGGVVSTNEE